MAYDNTFVGNIVTSSATAGATTYCGQIRVSDAGIFYFEDRHILADGPKWVAVEQDFDFESLTHKRLRKVTKYKAQYEIKIKMMGKDTLKQLAALESLMEGVQYTFDPVRGAIPSRRFYFTPPGDATRPTLEVVKVSSPMIDTKHLAGRYIGYSEHTLVIETVELFETKRLPTVEPIVTEVLDDGVLSYSWATPDIEVFA